MEYPVPVGFRFRPTDEEMVDHFLRLQNMGSNSINVDQVISTVDICRFDPWELPSESRMESSDQVWYFFTRKENKYKRGDRQCRKTKSGFWKKTGVTVNIKQKRGNRDKIGEKRVLVFHYNGSKSKSNWVMHEYQSTCFSLPNHVMEQSMPYTICKLLFKGEVTEIPSSSSASEIDHSHSSSITDMNISGGLISGSHEELLNPPHQFDEQREKEFDDEFWKALADFTSYDCPTLLDDEPSSFVSMDEYFSTSDFTSQ